MPEVLRTVKMDITYELSKEQRESIKRPASITHQHPTYSRTDEICGNKTANYNNVYGFAYEEVKNAVPNLPRKILEF